MPKKIKLACITGTRADYPRVKSVLREIYSRDNFELQLIVTGSHLLEEYGMSINEIISDGFKIDKKVPMFLGDYNTPYGMVKAVARCTDGIAGALNELKPDLVLLTVDRVETMAAAVAVSLMNFPIAHIQGGEVTGTIDESIRHAVTKLSHIHFPATEDAKNIKIKMGEDPNLVFNVGCPYIDIINSIRKKSKKYLATKYGFSEEKPIIIFTQHSVTTEYGSSSMQINITLEALRNFENCEIVVFASNTDAGGKEIINALKEKKNFVFISNMISEDFLSLMNVADVMVGNSSAAIREAPSFNLPAVNIGTRQQGRFRAENVIDVDHNSIAIEKAIKKSLFDQNFIKKISTIKNPYGDGKSAKRIVDKLEGININKDLIQKIITI